MIYGGDGPVGALIDVDPSSIDFGSVTDGQSADVAVTVTNIGDSTLKVINITTGNVQFTKDISTFNLAPGDSQEVIFTFSPTGVGVVNATATISSNSTSGQFRISLTGIGVAAGTKSLSINPSGLNFGSVKTGMSSAQFLFTITNTGTIDCTVNSIVGAGDYAITLDPSPVTLHAGDTCQFGITFSPSVEGLIIENAGATVNNDSPQAAIAVFCQGTGVLIFPAYIVTGINEVVVAAFFNANGGVQVMQFDPSDLNCEEDAYLSRQYTFENQEILPGQEKTVARLFFRYEDLGVTALQCLPSTLRQSITLAAQNIGTAGASGLIRKGYFDFEISDEVVSLMLKRAADGGSLSLTFLAPKLVPRGEWIENT